MKEALTIGRILLMAMLLVSLVLGLASCGVNPPRGPLQDFEGGGSAQAIEILAVEEAKTGKRWGPDGGSPHPRFAEFNHPGVNERLARRASHFVYFIVEPTGDVDISVNLVQGVFGHVAGGEDKRHNGVIFLQSGEEEVSIRIGVAQGEPEIVSLFERSESGFELKSGFDLKPVLWQGEPFVTRLHSEPEVLLEIFVPQELFRANELTFVLVTRDGETVPALGDMTGNTRAVLRARNVKEEDIIAIELRRRSYSWTTFESVRLQRR